MSGGMGDVQARWVNRIPTMPAEGSENQAVPRPPFQPYWPTGSAGLSRRVTTATPKPQPWLAKKRGASSDTAFWAGVRWSAVMVSTAARDRMRSPPFFPWFSSIRAKER